VVRGTPRTATQAEPELLTRWLLPASVLLLMLGAAGWVIRKFRQQMAADG
jgi:flagellar biogenesis protein FliO